MKKYILVLLIASATCLCSADAAKTNSPAADTNAPAAKNEAATIPDATHKPVFTTNTVTIAGQRVTYIAETGMLPILNADGVTRASVFYVAYTRVEEKAESGKRKMKNGPSLFVSTAGLARRPCGCTSARSARAA